MAPAIRYRLDVSVHIWGFSQFLHYFPQILYGIFSSVNGSLLGSNHSSISTQGAVLQAYRINNEHSFLMWDQCSLWYGLPNFAQNGSPKQGQLAILISEANASFLLQWWTLSKPNFTCTIVSFKAWRMGEDGGPILRAIW